MIIKPNGTAPAPAADLSEVSRALAEIVGDAYASPHDTEEWDRLANALTARLHITKKAAPVNERKFAGAAG